MKYQPTQEKLEAQYEALDKYESLAEDPRDPNHRHWLERAELFRQKITITEYLLFGDDKGLCHDDQVMMMTMTQVEDPNA